MKKATIFVRSLLIPLTIALLATACANTSSGNGGGTTPEDGGGNTDQKDVGGSNGKDAGTTGKTDGGGSGTAWTTKQVLEESHMAQAKGATCPQFTNGPKDIKVTNLVAVSPWIVASKGKLDGIFAQQKGGGAWSGAYVVGETKGAIAALKPGDTFTVAGDITVFYCATQISAKLVSKDGATELPVAVTVTLDKIGEAASDADRLSYENAYISVDNLTVDDPEAKGSDGKYHGDIKVVDAKGAKLHIRTGFDTSFSTYDSTTKTWSTTLKKGAKLKSLRGLYIFSYGAWQLDPFEDAGFDWE